MRNLSRASGSSPSRPGVTRPRDFSIDRSLCLVRDRSVTIVRYVNRGAGAITLRVRPLLALAKLPQAPAGNQDWDPTTKLGVRGGRVGPAAGLPSPSCLWGVFASTAPGSRLGTGTSRIGREVAGQRLSRRSLEPARVGVEAEARRWGLRPLFAGRGRGRPGPLPGRRTPAAGQAFARTGDSVFDELSRRAESFLVEWAHPHQATILAGFPWLADWGRQAMIAAPGLALAAGRFATAAKVLNTFAGMRRERLIPSHFSGEEGDSRVRRDRPFALVHPRRRVVRPGPPQSPREPSPMLEAVRSIIKAYRHGTRFGIGVGPDGLLVGGRPRPGR